MVELVYKFDEKFYREVQFKFIVNKHIIYIYTNTDYFTPCSRMHVQVNSDGESCIGELYQ